jgi:hypothetical protein
MISYNNKEIPAKEDVRTATFMEAGTTQGNHTFTPSEETPAGFKTNNGFFNMRRKYLAEYISSRQWQTTLNITRFNANHWQIWVIICTLCALCFGILAITTYHWTVDSTKHTHWGLWDTCYTPSPAYGISPPANNTLLVVNNSTAVMPVDVWPINRTVCTQQEMFGAEQTFADQWRITEVHLSLVLITGGVVFYFCALVTLFMSYKFVLNESLYAVRNTHILSIAFLVFGFILQLAGLFFFIFTQRFSFSMILMFVYFLLCIWVSNIINFLTVEFKVIKLPAEVVNTQSA